MVQERSHETRRKIVKAAMQLWTKRGFDEGFDTTTVDEIAEHAAISRATVYYYFPQKEAILGELAWITAEQTYKCALQLMMNGQSVDKILDEVVRQLGARVAGTPKAAVKRLLEVRRPEPSSLSRDASAGGLTRAFSVIITHAQEVGDLPRSVSSMEVAEILSATCMGSIQKWTIVEDMDLVETLRRRAAFLLAGARAAKA
jgi:AcrR family transcriptional regulator